MNTVIYSFIVTTLAGLSTLVGYIIVLFLKKQNNNIIAMSLAFASGIMLSVSFFDLIPNSYIKISNIYSMIITIIYICIFFIIGITCSFLIDKYLPDNNSIKNPKLYRVGFISLIAIILHNIPEGIVTFMVNTSDIELGLIITTSIILHNIPEGISIAVPIYYATNKKIKTFKYCFIAALSEPFGALLTYLFFYRYINDLTIGFLFSIIAGIMVRISCYELLPTSFFYQKKKLTIVSFLIGIIFIIVNHFL